MAMKAAQGETTQTPNAAYSMADAPEPTNLPDLALEMPNSVRLTRSYDVERLAADLGRVSGLGWKQQQLYTESGLGAVAHFDWRVLPLRSVGGAPDRTDPGGPGLAPFRDTRWLDDTPYLAEVLAGIPAPLRAVRLMALGRGAATRVHHETKYGPSWGTMRLHVVLSTVPEAVLQFGAETYQWQPGEFWFGNFCRNHRVSNDGDVRVHMVIDTLVTPELVALFPEDVRRLLVAPDVLFARTQVPLTAAEQEGLQCSFQVPTSFLSWEEPDGEFLTCAEYAEASIELAEGGLVLSIAGEPAFALVHLGDGEFRFEGWSEERTIQLGLDGRPAVTIRSRCGGTVRELGLPATT